MIHSDRPDGSTNPIGISAEKLLESNDCIVNCFDDFRNIGIDRVVSISGKDSTLKCYVEDGIPIHFHFGLWSSDGESDLGDYSAIVQSDISVPFNLATRARRIFDGISGIKTPPLVSSASPVGSLAPIWKVSVRSCRFQNKL